MPPEPRRSSIRSRLTRTGREVGARVRDGARRDATAVRRAFQPEVLRETVRRAPARTQLYLRERRDAAGAFVQRVRTGEARPSREASWTAGVLLVLILAVVLFLAFFDWNLLRGPISRYASEKTGRVVRIEGDLDVHPFSWSPSVEVNGLKVGKPAWAGEGQTADIQQLRAAVKLWPLLTGRVDVPYIEAQRPVVDLYSDAEGRNTWTFGDPNKPKDPDGLDLPLIRRLAIEGGTLRFRDERRSLTLDATVNSNETMGPQGTGAFLLEGRGALNGAPLTLTVRGGPLVNIRRDRPYEFEATLQGGSTRLVADGSVTRPFDLGRFTADLSLRGNDLAEIYNVTGLTTPNTPPYRIAGKLTRERSLWRFDDFSGRVGDSDLSGDLSVETEGERPLLTATLRSRSLDLDDLLALTGAPPSTGAGESASPEQRAMAGQLAAQGRLLPDAPLDVSRLRAMDARVDYRAASVKRNTLNVRQVHLGVNLDNAVLNLDPIAFQFGRGQLNATARINGRRAVPYTNLDARLSGYPIETLVPVVQGSRPVSGPMRARLRIEGPGASVHDLASNATGSASVVISRGEVRQAFAELMGINVGRGLYLLLSKDPRRTPLRCAVADFAISGGTARARTLVADTDVVVVHGSGSINLQTERMNLKFDGDSKKPRLLRLWAPITLSGPLRSPKPGVEMGSVVAQGGLAVALGAIFGPVAAILPFVEPGGAEDADCAGLISRAG